MNFKISPKTEFRFRKFKQEFEKAEKRALTMSEVLEKLMDKADSTAPQKKSKKFKKSKKAKKTLKVNRYVPAEKRQKLQQKYNGKCSEPSCNKPSTELHHPDRFALTHSHKNLHPLCRTHHQMAHSGLINENNSQTINAIDHKVLQFWKGT